MVRIVRKRGKTFLAAGIGRHGPYALVTHRVKGVGIVKATTGTRGTTLGMKRNVGGRSYEVGYNFNTRSPYAKSKRRRRSR